MGKVYKIFFASVTQINQHLGRDSDVKNPTSTYIVDCCPVQSSNSSDALILEMCWPFLLGTKPCGEIMSSGNVQYVSQSFIDELRMERA